MADGNGRARISHKASHYAPSLSPNHQNNLMFSGCSEYKCRNAEKIPREKS